MAELDRVSLSRIQLGNDTFEPGGCVTVTRRKLKKKAAHLRTENFRNRVEFFHQCFRPHHPFFMRDDPIHLHRIAKVLWRISLPGFYSADFGPTVKRSIELNCFKMGHVMPEPAVRRDILW